MTIEFVGLAGALLGLISLKLGLLLAESRDRQQVPFRTPAKAPLVRGLG